MFAVTLLPSKEIWEPRPRVPGGGCAPPGRVKVSTPFAANPCVALLAAVKNGVTAFRSPTARNEPVPCITIPPEEALSATVANWFATNAFCPMVIVAAVKFSVPGEVLVAPAVPLALLSRRMDCAVILVVPPRVLKPRISPACSASVPVVVKVPVP